MARWLPLAHRPHMTQSKFPGVGPLGRLWFVPLALSSLFFVVRQGQKTNPLAGPRDKGSSVLFCPMSI